MSAIEEQWEMMVLGVNSAAVLGSVDLLHSQMACHGSGIGLKCDEFHYIHRGGLRGFWARGRSEDCRMLAVVFAIVTGVNYVNDVGMVLSEEFERDEGPR